MRVSSLWRTSRVNDTIRFGLVSCILILRFSCLMRPAPLVVGIARPSNQAPSLIPSWRLGNLPYNSMRLSSTAEPVRRSSVIPGSSVASPNAWSIPPMRWLGKSQKGNDRLDSGCKPEGRQFAVALLSGQN